MIKVTFYPNDFTPGSADFQFKTRKALDGFIDSYQYFPGYKIFNYDIWDEGGDFGLPTLRNNDKSMLVLLSALGLH